MKLSEIILLLLGYVLMFCLGDDEGYESDFEVFGTYDGPKFQSISPDPGLNFSESFLFDPSSYHIGADYPGSDQSESDELIVREKRQEPEEDYDYSKSYREFVQENFGYPDKHFAGEDDSEDESNADYERIEENTENGKQREQPCKIIYKDGQECTVCKSSKLNAQSESCSYSSAPTPKKYAYKRERNYNSKDDEKDDNNSDDDDDEHDQHFVVIKKSAPPKRKVQNKLLARGSQYVPIENKKVKISHPSQTGQYYVDKVLEDFKTKDWSKCRRKVKNGVTCYYCKDQFGVNNEECVYSSDRQSNSNREDGGPKKSSDRSSRPPQPEDDYENQESIKKRTIKRMVMKIHGTDDEAPSDRKSFLYAKSVIHFTK